MAYAKVTLHDCEADTKLMGCIILFPSPLSRSLAPRYSGQWNSTNIVLGRGAIVKHSFRKNIYEYVLFQNSGKSCPPGKADLLPLPARQTPSPSQQGRPPPNTVKRRAVRILLEYILVFCNFAWGQFPIFKGNSCMNNLIDI